MEPIVHRDGDDLFTTSEIIAEGAGVQHKNILQNLDNHMPYFERFGRVTIEKEPLHTAGGIQFRRIAKLNEEQATLMLTFLRNNERVLEFKSNLVRAFYEMARRLQEPARQLSPDEIVAQALAITTQRVKELEPKAQAWDTLAGANGDYSVAETAQMLTREHGIEIGRNRLFEVMADLGWIYRWGKRQSWHAYQSQVDLGRLKLRMSAAFQNQKTGEMELPAPTIRITAKGVQALLAHLSSRKGAVAE